MRKRRLAYLALSLAVASTVSWVPSVRAEEMVVETDKTYTPGSQNDVSGYWVEFQRKRYARNQFYIANPVGRYDATIQEQFSLLAGLNRALSPAEMQAIYTKYGIPDASSLNYDSAAYHNFDWDSKLKQIEADLRSGALTAPKAADADVILANKLLSADNSADVVDALGASDLNDYIESAFKFNGGGEYVYSASDGTHVLSYHHGISYINPDQFDDGVYAQEQNKSVKDLLLGNPGHFKKLLGMGNLDSLVQAGRFMELALLVDKGINPTHMEIDTWVNTANGPVHIVESQPSADRLRDLARWLVASTWTTHSPIVLDLNHDGKIGVTGTSTAQKRLHQNGFVAQGAVWFDILANGKKQHIEWLKGDGDGFLVDDTNGTLERAAAGDGAITASVLFGDATGYANGYHKLAYKATKLQIASILKPDAATSWSTLFNKQPVLKGKSLQNLKIWTDANHDGLVQMGEVHALASLGITEIGSRPTIRRNQYGEYVIQSYFIQHGKRYMTEDVWFAEDPATQGK